jgi:hypothetical protein
MNKVSQINPTAIFKNNNIVHRNLLELTCSIYKGFFKYLIRLRAYFISGLIIKCKRREEINLTPNSKKFVIYSSFIAYTTLKK